MEYDSLFLSRIQFAFIISFHILFPAFTIGLASWLAFLEGAWLRTGRRLSRRCTFWLKIFAVSFGMGVVSGIVMSFQFGTNWAVLSDARRQHPRAAAGLRSAHGLLPGGDVPRRDAVRLEAGRARPAFLRHLHGRARHADLGLLDHLGQQLDADAGRLRRSRDGRSSPADWWPIVFNPSFPYRLVHMVLARVHHDLFVVGGVGAWYLLRAALEPGTRMHRCRMASGMIAVVRRCRSSLGDLHGLNVSSTSRRSSRRSKATGRRTTRGMPLVLFGGAQRGSGDATTTRSPCPTSAA